MLTVAGEIVNTLEALLASVTVTPPAAAGEVSDTGKATVCPAVSVPTTARTIPPPVAADPLTVTFNVVSPALTEEARIVADPDVTAVTGTSTTVVFAPNTTVRGTVATAGLFDVSVTSTPFCGAGPDSVSAIVDVSVPVIVSAGVAKLYPSPTRTDTRLGLRPVAPAVTVTDPPPMPFTRGCEFGVVCPSLKITFCNERLTLVGSLLMSSTKVTPCDGRLKVTGKGACSPSATTKLIGRIMSGGLNVMLAVVSANSAALARIVAEPGAMPVTITLADVALAEIVTLAGTVATAVFVEFNVIVVPPTGAGPDIVSVNVRVPTSINVMLDGEKLMVAVTRAVCDAGA